MVRIHIQAVYQKIVQLSYIDKLLEQVSLAFRDRYKNELVSGPFRMVNFTSEFNVSVRLCCLSKSLIILGVFHIVLPIANVASTGR